MFRYRVRPDSIEPRTQPRSEDQRPKLHSKPAFNPVLQALEARIVLSTVVWSGADASNSTDWSDAGNWQGESAPVAGDDLVFPAAASNLFPTNDFGAGTSFGSIDIQASDYDITGNSVELTGDLKGSMNSGSSVYELGTQLDDGIVRVSTGGQILAAGKISGTSGLELTGGGGLSLRGSVANTYSGVTTVDSGTLTLDDLPSRYSVTGDLVIGGSGSGVVNESASRQINPTAMLTVNTNGQFNVNGGTESIGMLNLNGNAQIYTGTSASLLSGLLTLGGTVTDNGTSGTATLNGVINLGTVDRIFDVTAGGLDVKATIQGNHALIKTGSGMMTMDNNTNQDVNAVDINVGVLGFAGSTAINELSTVGITVASGATMQIYGVGPVTAPVSIVGSGAGGVGALHDTFFTNDNFSDLTLAGNATIGSDSNGPTISSALTDGGSPYSLTKVGVGTLTFSGVNTYTGGTTINAGLLYVTGSIVGNVHTTTLGELGGTGTVGDATTSGGIIGAGTTSPYSYAIENYSSITLDSTATFSASAETGTTPGTGFNQVIVSGAVALNNATLSLPTYAFTPGTNNPLVLITGDTSLTGNFNGLAEGAIVGIGSYNFKITYVGGSGGHDVILNRIVSTTTTLAVPGDSTVFSQNATFTATVATIEGGTATGTVTFYHGETNLGTSTLSGGVATLTTSVLPAGANSITAVYGGDELDLTSNNDLTPVTQVVIKDGSTTTLTVPSQATVFGQSVTILASVAANAPGSGTPTGTVSFFDGTTLLGTPTLVSGQASYNTSSLTPGLHSFSLSYSGDSGYFQSFSSSGSQTVNKASTTISTPTTSGVTTFGQSVTFATTVVSVAPGAGTPTGLVTFLDGATPIGTGLLNGSGVATLSTTSLAAGTHPITALYGGDADFVTSTSSARSQVVSQSGTSTGLTASSTSVSYGQPVTITATLTAVTPGSGTPTGTVTFYDGATSLGVGTLDGTGVATLITASLGFGSRSVTARYDGDSNFLTSTSRATTILVSLASPTITLTSPTNPAVYGQSITLDVTISPPSANDGTPTGSVTFYDDNVSLGTGTLDGSGSTSITTSALTVGSHPITAFYSGDSNFESGTSSVTAQVVNKAASAETVSQPTAITFGQSASLTLTVVVVAPGAGTPTGTVTFFEGATQLGTGTLDGSGSATIVASGLAAGSHSITATYDGDSNFLATSSSAAATLIVGQSSTTATVASPSPVVFGQSASLSVTIGAVAPGSGTPTGTVTFYDGSTPLGLATLSSGIATLDPTGLVAGSHSITAVYGGDSNFVGSTSVAATLVVGQSSTTATLSPPASVVFGQSATLTATLAAVAPGSGTPTGMVSFYQGLTLLGAATLDGSGVATFLATGLAVGDHMITAEYAGDSNFVPSAAAAVTLTVTRSPSTAVVAPTTAVVFGQSATVSADLSATAPGSGKPTGTVSFYEGQTLLGSALLDGSGTASIAVTGLSVGNHSITASYPGDANFLASTSSATPLTVGQASTTATVSPPTSVAFGQSASLTVTLTANAPGAGTPTGTVIFYDGATFLGMATLDGSASASITVPGLAVGTHPITATYDGDDNFTTSTSAITNLVIAAESTTTTITPIVSASTYGEPVTFSVVVASNAIELVNPTGTVTFFDGATALGTATLNGIDHATFTTSSLGGGSHTISAVYGGDADFASSTSLTTTQLVNRSGSSSTLVTPSPVVFGQSATLTATLAAVAPGSGTPTGILTYYEGLVVLGTATIDGVGTATFHPSNLAVGNHTITAQYAGDANFAASAASAVTITVTRSPSTAIVAPTTAVVYGQSATVSADLSATAPGSGTPTGTVSFYEGVTLLGSDTLDGTGIATITITGLTVGNHSITASYPGDLNFLASTSAVRTLVVAKSSTTATVAPPLSIIYGQSASLTASVTANAPGEGTPTGTVSFYDGVTLLGTATLNGSDTASISVPGLVAGSHPITVVYSGDGNFTTSTSAATNLSVNTEGTTTTITPVVSASTFGQPVTFSVVVVSDDVEPLHPTGMVTFFDGATALGTATLGGTDHANFTTSALGAGSHTISAVYGGDFAFSQSTSGTTTQVVIRASSTSELSSSEGSSVFGQPVSFTTTVVAVAPGVGVPTGTVSFYDGATLLGTVSLDGSGSAVYQSSEFAIGSHTISAVFGGDANFLASTTSSNTEDVTQASSTAAVVSSDRARTYGQSVTFTATVTAVAPGVGVPSGTVTFYNGLTSIGSYSLAGNSNISATASVTLSSLNAGELTITASYSSDSNFLGSTSPAITEVVSPAATTTTLAPPSGQAVFGQPQDLIATVAVVAPGMGTPTGMVDFFDGTTLVGSAATINGVATLETSNLSQGSLPLTAALVASNDFLGSTSPPVSQVVGVSSTTTVVSGGGATVFGQPATFGATVQPVAPAVGIPTGLVLFEDGTVPIGSALLNNQGFATVSVTSLGIGPHSIHAVYAGDSGYAISSGSPISATVSPSPSTLKIAAPSLTVYGQMVTLSSVASAAAPGSGTPNGTVAFYDGQTLLGTEPLAAGIAYLSVPEFGGGIHSLTAQYSGDADFQPDTSSAVILTVTQSPATATIKPPASVIFGQSATLTASLAAVAPGSGTPTGMVTFYDGTTALGIATLVGGTATLTTTPTALSVGQHSITASYSGDAIFRSTVSPSVTEMVAQCLSGTVFLDKNASGTLDAGEPGLGGRVVFLDLNHDGNLDPGDPTTTTDTNGNYLFYGVGLGTEPVVEATSLDTSDRYVIDQSNTNADGSVNIGVVPITPVAPVPVVPNPFNPTPGSNPNVAFVQSLYRAVLARDGGAGEIAGWVAKLKAGMSREQVALDIVNSPEHRRDQVYTYYEEFLNRAPDATSSSWVNALLAGKSEETVVEGILGSTEYLAAHQDSANFVSSLYLEVLGRQGDASSQAIWQSALNSGTSRQQVVDDFVQSTEAIDQVVDSFYTAFLHRPPELGGTSQGWAAILKAAKGSATNVATAILASDEFDLDAVREG